MLLGHEDSVWDLAYSSNLKRLASCSADGTVRIWDAQSSTPCITVFNKEKGGCVICLSYTTHVLGQKADDNECGIVKMPCVYLTVSGLVIPSLQVFHE